MSLHQARKRVRTARPCEYCRSKKIRCEFPRHSHEGSNQAPAACNHCAEFGLPCIVSNGQMDTQQSLAITQPAQEYSLPVPMNVLRPAKRQLRDRSDGTRGSNSSLSPVLQPSPANNADNNGDDTSNDLSTGVGLLSLSGSQEATFLGGSSGITWAKLVSGTLRREGIHPKILPSGFVSGAAPITTPSPFSNVEKIAPIPVLPPLPPPHLRIYYLDTAYRHIQARYACLNWRQIKQWSEQADTLCQWPTAVISGSRTPPAFFIWLVYGYGTKLTEDLAIPGAIDHEIYYNAAISCLPSVTFDRSLLSVQAQLFLTLYTYRHTTSDLSLWRLGGTAFRAVQEIGLHRRTPLAGERHRDAYEEEMRRRTFWTAYILDRMISLQLGRPCLFNDRDIDIPIPLNIGDDFAMVSVIAQMQSNDQIARPVSDEVTTMTSFLHCVSLSRIRGIIHETIYRPENQTLDTTIVEQLLIRLKEWRRQHPRWKTNGECLVQLCPEHWEMEYHHSIQVLLRPLSIDTSSTERYAVECMESAGGLCRNQWTQIQRSARNLSKSALYRLFLSGITLIYLALRQTLYAANLQRVQVNLTACAESLKVFAAEFVWAADYRRCFDQLCQQLAARMPSLRDPAFMAIISDTSAAGSAPSQPPQTDPFDAFLFSIPSEAASHSAMGQQPMEEVLDLDFDALLATFGINTSAPDVWDPQLPMDVWLDPFAGTNTGG